jgi:hypothetical protein
MRVARMGALAITGYEPDAARAPLVELFGESAHVYARFRDR